MSQGVWLGLKAEEGSLIAWVLVYLKQKNQTKKSAKITGLGTLL